MTKDTSQFLGPDEKPKVVNLDALQQLGWQSFFAQQTDVDLLSTTPPVRVTEVHRSGIRALGDGLDIELPPSIETTVGDWVLYDADRPIDSVVLERKSLIKRRAAGHDRTVQLIAANIDTAFIVTSCNADFKVARLERYIALALEADVAPVILLTKLDTSDAPQTYVTQAQAISDRVPVIALDARASETREVLSTWCKPGQTVAFLGSSGVGKSTMVNTLAKAETAQTQSIREDDARGRHTTTYRHLHILPGVCCVLDTPGMRELQLTDASAGVADLFSDLSDLTHQCKFNDCSHETEPGCAIRAAVAAGDLDPSRVVRWQKLLAEDAQNTASLAERRAKDKGFGKMVKNIKKSDKRGRN
jgi:ribosome biogenesis GTPase